MLGYRHDRGTCQEDAVVPTDPAALIKSCVIGYPSLQNGPVDGIDDFQSGQAGYPSTSGLRMEALTFFDCYNRDESNTYKQYGSIFK